jgi:hypothetical protein
MYLHERSGLQISLLAAARERFICDDGKGFNLLRVCLGPQRDGLRGAVMVPWRPPACGTENVSHPGSFSR